MVRVDGNDPTAIDGTLERTKKDQRNETGLAHDDTNLNIDIHGVLNNIVDLFAMGNVNPRGQGINTVFKRRLDIIVL